VLADARQLRAARELWPDGVIVAPCHLRTRLQNVLIGGGDTFAVVKGWR
jgi:hypothetical protein